MPEVRDRKERPRVKLVIGLSRNKVAVPEGAAGTPPFWSLVSKVNLAAHFKETLQQHRFRRRFEPSAAHSEAIRSVH